MNNSSYIANLPESSYMEVHSSLAGVSDAGKRKIYDAIVSMGDTIFPSKRGQVFTLALTAGGLANNGADLNKYYWDHSKVIDGYFNRIDMKALGDAVGPGVGERVSGKLPAVVTGMALGFGAALVLRVFRIM